VFFKLIKEKKEIMPSRLVQGGSSLGEEDEEDIMGVFTSVDPLTQDHRQSYKKFYFGRKCFFLFLGVVVLATVLVLVTVFLVNNENIFLKLSGKDDDNVTKIVSFLPKCSPIDTSQLWTPKQNQVLLVGLGRGGQQSNETIQEAMEIVANTSACKEPPKVPCIEGMVAVDLGEKVLMCGGNVCKNLVPRTECRHLKTFHHDDGPTTQGWRSEEFVNLNQGRSGASAVLTDKGWWVTGGLVLDPLILDPLSSVSLPTATAATELLEVDPVEMPLNITEKSFIKGPDLPFALHKHCLLQIAPGLTLLIGGIAPTSPSATLATTLLYNWTSKSWCQNGNLVSPRAGLSSALLTNLQGELLSLDSQTWMPGPSLPDEISHLPSSHLTVLPDEKILLAGVGNISSQVFSKTEKTDWKEEVGLKLGREDGLFFEVGEQHLICDQEVGEPNLLSTPSAPN